MDFTYLLISAKGGNRESAAELLEMYSPLLFKESVVDGCFDEDLLQELQLTLLLCIQKFDIFR